MADLETALELLKLPKEVLDQMERFASTLFGPSAREFGELLADRVRFIRYRHQVRFLLKAEELLRSAGLSPRAVPLRTLLPLVEAASLEEDESIQSMWASLLARASQDGAQVVLHSACIQVLRSISPVEAHLLNHLHRIWSKRDEEARSRGETYPAEKLRFRPKPLLAELEVSEEDVQLVSENLIRLGVAGRTRSTEVMTLTTLGLRVLQEVITDGWQEAV